MELTSRFDYERFLDSARGEHEMTIVGRTLLVPGEKWSPPIPFKLKTSLRTDRVRDAVSYSRRDGLLVAPLHHISARPRHLSSPERAAAPPVLLRSFYSSAIPRSAMGAGAPGLSEGLLLRMSLFDGQSLFPRPHPVPGMAEESQEFLSFRSRFENWDPNLRIF